MAFKIKINDGYCEYEYDLPISGDNSIYDVIGKIYKDFGIDEIKIEGNITWSAV